MDGGFFGPSFPQHFLLHFPDLVYFKQPDKFIPKLFGFKIYGKEGSKYTNTQPKSIQSQLLDKKMNH